MEIWKIIVAFVSPFPGQRSLEKCFVFIYIYIKNSQDSKYYNYSPELVKY